MLQTEILILQSFTIEDSKALFAYRSDEETNKYQGWIPKSVADAASFITKLPIVFDLPESWYQLAIRVQQTKELIGDIGIHFIGDDKQQCELGCTIRKRL
jgi:RimJ/RimL family protein N-acetyltransferase